MTVLLVVFLAIYKLDSTIGRVLIWTISTDMFLSSPIFGIGLGNFEVDYLYYQAEFLSQHQNLEKFNLVAGMTYYAFNDFLQIATETGIVGIILFLVIIYLCFRNKQIKSKNIYAIRASILGIIIFAIFSYPFSIFPVQLHFFVFLALFSNSENQHPLTISLKSRGNIRNFFYAFIFITNILFLSLNIKRYKATLRWKELLQQQEGIASSAGNVNDFLEIYDDLRYKGSFLYNYGAILYEQGDYSNSLKILKEAASKFNHVDLQLYLGKNYMELENYYLAENYFQTAYYMAPSRFLSRYLLVRLYERSGKQNEAIVLAKEIVLEKPKINSRIVQQIKEEMREFVKKYSL